MPKRCLAINYIGAIGGADRPTAQRSEVGGRRSEVRTIVGLQWVDGGSTRKRSLCHRPPRYSCHRPRPTAFEAGYVHADGTRCRQPDPATRSRPVDVAQRAAQVAQPVGLADDVGVQRDAHHQRLPRATARASRRTGRRSSARSPCRPSGAPRSSGCRSAPAGRARTTALRPLRVRIAHRLVVVAPVQRVAVAGLGQQVGREPALARSRATASPQARCPLRCAHAVAAQRQQLRARRPRPASPWRSALLWPWPTSSSPRATQAATSSGQWS